MALDDLSYLSIATNHAMIVLCVTIERKSKDDNNNTTTTLLYLLNVPNLSVLLTNKVQNEQSINDAISFAPRCGRM